MRVLVNALPFRHGGGTTYFQQEMAALARVAPELALHSLVSPWAYLEGLPGITETVPVKSVAGRFAYEQLCIPMRQADLLYCPANFGPMGFRAPIVLTLHNPNYYRAGLELAETKPSRPLWKVHANHLAMKRSDAIVAISQSFAAEVIATVPGIAARLHVIHSGAPEWPEESVKVEGLPERYIVVVASEAPHKRVVDVVSGWARSLEMTRHAANLVLVGGFTKRQASEYRNIADRQSQRILFLGQVRRRDKLKWIYENAVALISMSLLEAFPLTPAEAGSVGCPLVLSDIPTHREVTLGNAVFVPPGQPAILADVLASDVYSWQPGSRLWQWPFTWDDHAEQLRSLFQQTSS